MYRPSGIAIVTAGLAALALFHVVWGGGTRQAEPWLQLDAPTPKAALDFGTTFQVHSGAWRAWPAPVEEEPAKTPVALPAPKAPAGVAAEATMAPDQSAASMQQTAEREPGTALPTVAAGFTAFPEPATPPAAMAPTPPTPLVAEGRMALGNPEAPTPTSPAPPGHSAPRTHDRAPEVGATSASENKFGPAIFKQFDGKGS